MCLIRAAINGLEQRIFLHARILLRPDLDGTEAASVALTS
jgi:hypothetical protein